MAKRGKLEIIRDILFIIQENRNSIKKTPLIRKSNLSTGRFNEYYSDLMRKRFVIEIVNNKSGKVVSLSEKGRKFLEKYQVIVSFIDEFNL